MMKINDDALIFRTWEAQLALLPRAVLHKYVTGNYNVVLDSWYKQASSIHLCQRELITEKIKSQQLRKRIVQLINGGAFSWSQKGCTFMIDNEQAKEAFSATREWWLSRGVPTGYANGKSNTAPIPDLREKIEQCKAEIMSEFRQIDWSQVSYMTSSSSLNGLHTAE